MFHRRKSFNISRASIDEVPELIGSPQRIRNLGYFGYTDAFDANSI